VLQRYHDSSAEGKPSFELFPAIDLRGGRVVQLVRGDFGTEIAYAEDAVAMARSFVAEGARWLHVVDLDGALTGRPQQADMARAIVASVGTRACVQVAGGLRDQAAVTAALATGAARVVIGTAALADVAFAATLVAAHGRPRIAVALDVRDGMAVGGAWLAEAGSPVESALDQLATAGIETFVVTAISRDGTLSGPDLTLLDRLVRLGRGQVVASGGIGSLDDLRRVRALGCVGAILGRALYESRFSLADALDAVR